MGQIVAIGEVKSDLELQTSAKNNRYIRLTLKESLWYAGRPRYQYYQVWAFKSAAAGLVTGKVKKGSLIWVSGQIELESFAHEDGTKDKRLKIFLSNWGFVQTGRPRGPKPDGDAPHAEAGTMPAEAAPSQPIGVVYGDKDVLPE